MPFERRRRRSPVIQEALDLQLKALARRANVQTVVLADDLGLVVAVAGDSDESEEFAAMTTQLAPGQRSWEGQIRTRRGSRQVTVVPLRGADTDFWLCAVGGIGIGVEATLSAAGDGIRRIVNLD